MDINIYDASVPDEEKRQLSEDFAMARSSSWN